MMADYYAGSASSTVLSAGTSEGVNRVLPVSWWVVEGCYSACSATNPGYTYTDAGGVTQTQPTMHDLGYDATGRLTSVRDPLANDTIAHGTRSETAALELRTVFSYDSTGRVKTVKGPEPTPGGARKASSYRYFPLVGQTKINRDGFVPSEGRDYFRWVVYDTRLRITSDRDPAGLKTRYDWNDKDQLVATIDPTRLKTVYGFDHADRATDVWGPAPEGDFDPATNRPRGDASVPHSTTAYDEGLKGLATALWSNPYLAGSPARHTTTFHVTGDNIGRDWGASPPVSPNAGGQWSVRFSGEVTLGNAGPHQFHARTKGVVRMWMDDTLLFTQASDADPDPTRWLTTPTGSFTSTTANERHRIRIDYQELNANAGLEVYWTRPDSATGRIGGSKLSPRYGLVTSTVDPDGKATSTEYRDDANKIGPEHGLATASIVDPAGLALRTSTTYENPALGGYLRRVAKTMPSGSRSSFGYYGETEAPLADQCNAGATTPQGGALKQSMGPDPDGTGPALARVEQFVHDSAGRRVGVRKGDTATIDSATWSCVLFDGRGRMRSETFAAHGPAAPKRQVFYQYAAGGDPLTTNVVETAVDDAVERVTTVVDLAGRPVIYRSPGHTTTTAYDQLGRVSTVNGPVGAQTFTYEPATGRADQTMLDGVVLGGCRL